ncbi:MAG: hypothetical protein KDJ65_35350, partial [Anaerolineae bacterium]|nr:hypothetical protein [Anaerolineae bacterium]
WLDRHADRVDQTFFPTYNINLYLGPAAIDSQMVEQTAPFAHGITLRGFQILDKSGRSKLIPPDDSEPQYLLTIKPEDDFTLSLYWQTNTAIEAPYTVFTHLVAADGFNRTSQDNQPVWGTYPTTAWSPDEKITDKYTLTVPPGTPPGDHHLRVGWYHSDTLERVAVLNESGQPGEVFNTLPVIIRVEQESNLAKDE